MCSQIKHLKLELSPLNSMKKTLLILSAIRCIPHVLIFLTSKNKSTIVKDFNRWLKIMESKYSGISGLIYLLTFYKEYRNLFYYRVGNVGHLLNIICPKESTLHIYTKRIGPGLFIQHGFSTIISAESIGSNCWINQQVTIGFSNKYERPVLKDNVTIYAGAKVIGQVTIENNSVVGANAVVVKDVPDHSVVVGIPAQIIKRNGVPVEKQEQ
jgi:serine O-acetyltransferase